MIYAIQVFQSRMDDIKWWVGVVILISLVPNRRNGFHVFLYKKDNRRTVKDVEWGSLEAVQREASRNQAAPSS